jgi:KUP system potassium uptake protein
MPPGKPARWTKAGTETPPPSDEVQGEVREQISQPASLGAALLCMGIVYGDLGTSPLYTLQTIAQIFGDRFTPEVALGALSLIFWALIVTISVKYCLFVMRADNHGEGGILALMTLTGARWAGRGRSLVVMGLFGAALIYGDGIITPAISVLSALEGLNVATDFFQPYTMPMAVVILVALFAIQSRGTATVGKAFGPVMLVWFVTIGVLGLFGIVQHPQVLAAVNPAYGFTLLTTHGFAGFAVLGGVFLALTGGEALYADMGHIGRNPIRATWYGLVLPALLLNYAGQIGLFMSTPAPNGNPFFHLAPGWMIYPLVGLATLATIIASQAIITGSFSMTRQAMQLGWFPGVRIRQTSADAYGQIYVPFINWAMMFFTVALTASFGSSDRLAGAYGTAVSTTMVLTTALLYNVMRKRWHWPALQAAAVTGVFLLVDLAFFSANLLKIREGGWIPLSIGAVIFIIMTTWHEGVAALHRRGSRRAGQSAQLLQRIKDGALPRVPGTAIFLTRFATSVPPIIQDYAERTGVLHQTVIALTVSFEDVPRVHTRDRVRAVEHDSDIWHVTCRFGFVEIPDLPAALKQPRNLPAYDHAIYYIERDDIVSRPRHRALSRWRMALFSFMFRNAAHAIDRFRIPSHALVEIGRRIEL